MTRVQQPGAPDRPRLFLFYPPGFGASTWRRAYDEGERPEVTHWSMHLAERHGFEVVSSDDSTAVKVATLVTKLTFRVFRCHVHHLWHNRHRLRDADIVWAMSERELIAALLGAMLTPWRRRPALVGEVVWLADEWPTYGPLRRLLLRWLFRWVDALLTTTEGGARLLRALLPGVDVRVYRFGAPLDHYAGQQREPGPNPGAGTDRPIRVLVAGNDLHRDWGCVAAAFADDPRFEVTLLSRWPWVERFATAPNIRYRPGGRLKTLIDWYRWADVMVMALKPNAHASGTTMLLEAAAMGLPVVCTAAGHIDEYMRPDEVVYVPPSRPAALREAAAELFAQPGEAALRARRAQEAVRERALDAAGAVARRCAVLREMMERRRGRLGSWGFDDESSLHGLGEAPTAFQYSEQP